MLVAALTVSALTGCFAGPSESYEAEQPDKSAQCARMFDIVMKGTRAGEQSDRLTEGWAIMSESCPSEFDIVTDYASGATKILGMQSCSMLAERIRPEAVEMLSEDGYCEDAPATAGWPNGGLGWDAAREQAGTFQRVCGPLTSMRNTYDGAFVNVGLDYPNPGRFTFIIWGVELQPLPSNATVCASGNIYDYQGGTAQMELASAQELEIWQ